MIIFYCPLFNSPTPETSPSKASTTSTNSFTYPILLAVSPTACSASTSPPRPSGAPSVCPPNNIEVRFGSGFRSVTCLSSDNATVIALAAASVDAENNAPQSRQLLGDLGRRLRGAASTSSSMDCRLPWLL